jgi:serine/threonine protein phosphatase PrpC
VDAAVSEGPAAEQGEVRQTATVAAAQPDVVSACPTCGEPAVPGARFCEACGAELDAAAPTAVPPADGEDRTHTILLPGAGDETADPAEPVDEPVAEPAAEPAAAARPCAQCGGTIAEDGYCEMCGAPAVRDRDHWVEQPSAWVGGVCDRGVRHLRNEDAMALAADEEPGGFAVLVVCDGVSTARDSDVASMAAARIAREVLTARRTSDGSPSGADDRIQAWTERLGAAAEAASEAVIDVADHPTDPQGRGMAGDFPAISPASCTFVAAVIDGGLGVVGWLGDSRAYWLPDAGQPQQLSLDDSWAGTRIAMGMARAQAENSPQAHAITRWLGPDNPDHQPECTSIRLDSPGWLLVCSDGMWNYCSPADELRELVTSTVAATGEHPAEVAGALVSWANEQGGQDNVTVALARVQAEPVPEPAPEHAGDTGDTGDAGDAAPATGAEEDTAPGTGG